MTCYCPACEAQREAERDAYERGTAEAEDRDAALNPVPSSDEKRG